MAQAQLEYFNNNYSARFWRTKFYSLDAQAETNNTNNAWGAWFNLLTAAAQQQLNQKISAYNERLGKRSENKLIIGSKIMVWGAFWLGTAGAPTAEYAFDTSHTLTRNLAISSLAGFFGFAFIALLLTVQREYAFGKEIGQILTNPDSYNSQQVPKALQSNPSVWEILWNAELLPSYACQPMWFARTSPLDP